MSALQTTHALPADLQFRTWRVGSSADTPQLTLTELPSLTMDGSPKAKSPGAISAPNPLQNRPSTSPRSDSVQQVNQLSRSVSRRSSVTPRKNSVGNDLPTPTPSPAGEKPSDSEGSPWVGAVGRATLGKSGRVIERLMADIDKLKRELNAEISHRQEIERREDLNRGAIDGLRTENENLQQAKEIDAAVLRRRDRKIEDLKADLEAEKERRIRAEQNAKDANAERDDVAAKSRRDIAEAKEVAHHAARHAEVLEQSHKQLSAEYRQRAEVFSRDLQRVVEVREEEQRKVKRLDVVVEQLRQDIERSTKLNVSLNEAFETYKETAESRISQMQEKALKDEAANAALSEEAERVVGEARWLINLGKNASKRLGHEPPEK